MGDDGQTGFTGRTAAAHCEAAVRRSGPVLVVLREAGTGPLVGAGAALCGRLAACEGREARVRPPRAGARRSRARRRSAA
jgi:hypothetical protein